MRLFRLFATAAMVAALTMPVAAAQGPKSGTKAPKVTPHW